MRELVYLYSDGACRGNPGPSAIGFFATTAKGIFGKTDLVRLDEFALFWEGVPIGEGTNNRAEYCSLIAGLKAALKRSYFFVDVRMDSLLVIKQMLGEYKVKNSGLLPLYKEAKILSEKFQKIRFTHIPRESNQIADALANQALDKRG